MKILLLLAKGVEMIEASAFIDVFGWNKHYNNTKTEIVTCGLRRELHSTFNIPIQVDLVIDEVRVDEYDALAIPGGFEDYGFYEDAYDEKFLDIIRKFNEEGKVIASICVGALPIGKSGILQGRKGTTYHLMDRRRQKQLESFGVKVVNEPVVIDKNIITSWCPSTATDVALKLLELLTSEEESCKTREIMGF
jgi:4-methyl-5(b-hydroxyethyl)-thiazole monophosphate biosynthesis